MHITILKCNLGHDQLILISQINTNIFVVVPSFYRDEVNSWER